MAVPKRKVSPSRRGMRRSGHHEQTVTWGVDLAIMAREITNRIAPAGDPDIDSGAKLADDAFNTARASQPPQSFALPSITPRTIGLRAGTKF